MGERASGNQCCACGYARSDTSHADRGMWTLTSLAHFTPRPTCPLWSPTTTNALKRVRCPARVCFWTGMIFITSSFRDGPKKFSTIWYSLMGIEKR